MTNALTKSSWSGLYGQAKTRCLIRFYSRPNYTPPSPAGASEAEVQSAQSYCLGLLQYDTPFTSSILELVKPRLLIGNWTLPPIHCWPSSLPPPEPSTSPSAPSISKLPASPTRSPPLPLVPCACNSGVTTSTVLSPAHPQKNPFLYSCLMHLQILTRGRGAQRR